MPVTSKGYAIPVIAVNSANNTNKGRSSRFMATSLDQPQCRERHVDRLDADERNDDASHAVDQQISAQERGGAERPVFHSLQSERDQQDDDQRVENHRRQD